MKQTTGQALQGFRPSSPVRLGQPSFHSAEPNEAEVAALLLVAIRRRRQPRLSPLEMPSLPSC